MRALRAVLALALSTATAAAVAMPASAAPAPARAAAAHQPQDANARPLATDPRAGTYVPITPFRAADTRKTTSLAAKHALTVKIGGRGAVPAKNVGAVALTVTALSPTSSGVLTAYAYGSARPAARSVTYRAKATTATTVVSKVSATGLLSVYNLATSGRTGVVVDVYGYWVTGSSDAAGTLHTLSRPTRVLAGAVPKSGTRTLSLGGHNGVPTSGVGSAFVSITALSPAASGGLTAVSKGNDPPTPKTVRLVKGQSTTAFAVVATDDSGRIDLINSSSAALPVYVDLIAWTPAGPAAKAGAVQTRFPARVLNSRALKSGGTTTVPVVGRAGVPLGGVAAVLASITAENPAKSGGLTAWSGNTGLPGVTSVQFMAGASAANLVLVAVGTKGTISVHNSSGGTTTLYVDVVGYLPRTTVTAPAASTSRYIRSTAELTDRFGDPSKEGEGCFDAAHGATFVLLQFGKQRDDKQGVQLTVSQDKVTYEDIVDAVDNYLTSFTSGSACGSPASATIALGTNNSGDFKAYSASDRGTDWATKVIDAVDVPTGTDTRITLVGANDIEQLFDGTYQNGVDWETAYLEATDDDLIFNGSADGCDTAYGTTGAKCAYWTMSELYHLAGGLDPRITALPQIYNAGMAAQWTNIFATGDASGKERPDFFAGVLTQSAVCQGSDDPACAATYTPQQGWTALYRGLSTVVTTPRLPVVTDLRSDS